MQHQLSNFFDDALATSTGSAMHKRMAGTTEADQVLHDVIRDSLAVLDVVEVDASVGGAAPATSTAVSIVHRLPERRREQVARALHEFRHLPSE